MIKRGAGNIAGGGALLLIAANALFYCGFILRSGADRFVAEIYTAANPQTFVFVMLALGLIAALGPKKAIVRAAKIFAPILWAVLALVLVFGLTTVDFSNLLPLTRDGALPLLRGAVPVVNVYLGILVYASFFEGPCPLENRRTKAWALWMLPVILLLTADSTAIVGNYGEALTSRLSYPFFTMLRDVTIFNSIERIEAFVVALWVLPDFIVFAVTLTSAVKCIQLAFDLSPAEDAWIWDMKKGRWLIPVCAATAVFVALILPADSRTMQYFSSQVVPALNLGVCLVILPLCFIVGKLRGRI